MFFFQKCWKAGGVEANAEKDRRKEKSGENERLRRWFFSYYSVDFLQNDLLLLCLSLCKRDWQTQLFFASLLGMKNGQSFCPYYYYYVHRIAIFFPFRAGP